MEKGAKISKALPVGQFGNKTILTAIVYFSHDKTGRPYTQAEKDANMNRFFFPSFDFRISEKGATITEHNEAYKKMMAGIERRKNTIITALIHANMDDGEYRVAKITKANVQIYAKPVYGIGKNFNDVIIRRWEGNALKMNRRDIISSL